MTLGTTLMIKGKIAKYINRLFQPRLPAPRPFYAAVAPDPHLFPSPCSFAINLGAGPKKVGLHFNPRFDQSTIVLNSFDGEWGKEVVVDHLRFSQGSEIMVTVAFDSDGFKVMLPDGHQISFPNRLGLCQLPYLSVEGGQHHLPEV
nr:galectin-2-like [Dasypus novemcinctus]